MLFIMPIKNRQVKTCSYIQSSKLKTKVFGFNQVILWNRTTVTEFLKCYMVVGGWSGGGWTQSRSNKGVKEIEAEVLVLVGLAQK